jgi:hypothetical protein
MDDTDIRHHDKISYTYPDVLLLKQTTSLSKVRPPATRGAGGDKLAPRSVCRDTLLTALYLVSAGARLVWQDFHPVTDLPR